MSYVESYVSTFVKPGFVSNHTKIRWRVALNIINTTLECFSLFQIPQRENIG